MRKLLSNSQAFIQHSKFTWFTCDKAKVSGVYDWKFIPSRIDEIID